MPITLPRIVLYLDADSSRHRRPTAKSSGFRVARNLLLAVELLIGTLHFPN